MSTASTPEPRPDPRTADAALRASEAKLRTVVEHIPQKIFVKDRNSRYLFVNGNYARDLGLTPAEAIGTTDTQFFSKDLAEKYQADDRRIIETGRTEEFEEEYLQDGKRVWIQIIKAPVRAQDGAILGVCGIFRDISEKRESQIALRRRGEILAAVCFAAQRFLHESHWRVSIADVLARLGRAADVSRAVLFAASHDQKDETTIDLIEEWTASESLRRTQDPTVHNLPLSQGGFGRWADTLARGQVLHGHVRDFPAREQMQLVQHGILSIVVVPVLSGGRWWGFLAFDQCDRERTWNGEETESLKAAANILGEAIHRERAEASLARVTRLQNLVLDAAGEGILGLDTEGRHTFVNPAATRMLGFEPDELIGFPSHLTWHQPRSDPPSSVSKCPLCVALRLGKILRKDTAVFWRKDGTSFPVEYVSTPILEDGVQLGTVVAFDDITQRRHLEAQLQQSQKLEAIGQLAGGVAHDFNNILAATFLNLDLLRQPGNYGEDSRRCLDELEADLRRAANLTRQLLLFARRSVIQIRPVHLGHVVENLLEMLRRIIGETIALEWRCSSPMPPVAADVGMLEQVVVNLVVNARDAMPDGGRITLESRTITLAQDAPHPTHPDARPGDYVRLSVADTGRGMGRDVLDRLFEPFFTTKEPGKGTGLGLATVYSIARQHRGWVAVESEVGKGSQFHVFLPALPSESPPEPPGPPSAGSSPKGTEVILLVEDEASLRRSVAGFFRLYGYRVLEASDGPSAIALWQKHQDAIDLLFTDMVMPNGINGLQLAQTLRTSRPDLKVILASGYSAGLYQETDLAAQSITFVSKPCDPRTLTVLVRATLDQAPVTPLPVAAPTSQAPGADSSVTPLSVDLTATP